MAKKENLCTRFKQFYDNRRGPLASLCYQDTGEKSSSIQPLGSLYMLRPRPWRQEGATSYGLTTPNPHTSRPSPVANSGPMDTVMDNWGPVEATVDDRGGWEVVEVLAYLLGAGI